MADITAWIEPRLTRAWVGIKHHIMSSRARGGSDEQSWRVSGGVFLLACAFLTSRPRRQPSQAVGGGITMRTATVDGITLQYLSAGHGPAIVLLHGYAETSRMWRPLMPRLAEHFTVIAPDLPGIGGSDIPKDGLDMAHAGARIHGLVKSLQIEKAVVVATTSV